MELDERAARRLQGHGSSLHAVTPCRWKGRPAALGLTRDAVALEAGGRVSRSKVAARSRFTADRGAGAGAWELGFHGDRAGVVFDPPEQGEAFLAQLHAVTDVAAQEAAARRQRQPVAGPVSPRAHRRDVVWGLVAAGVIVVVVASLLVWRHVRETSTLQVIGSVVLLDTASSGANVTVDGGTCTGTGEFADVTTAAAVRVVDADGDRRGPAPLSQGRGDPSACVFFFAVELPSGQQWYDVQLGSRPPVRETQDQLHDLRLVLG